MSLTFGSLFAGIGGFDLGFERAGMRCVWQVEIDDYCRRVLAKHWPDVRRHDDVRTFPPAGDWYADVICGGFPCQDISVAGRGAGLDGGRSGLWFEYGRIVRVLRPRFVVVENSPALLGRGLGRVLGDLAASGYDSEWTCIPAAAVGAPHLRDRAYIVAYPERERLQAGRAGGSPADGDLRTGHQRAGHLQASAVASGSEGVGPNANCAGPQGRGEELVETAARRKAPTAVGPNPAGRGGPWWATEPDVGRVADGVPARVDRLRGLGNAVVPQVAEWIGRRIVDASR